MSRREGSTPKRRKKSAASRLAPFWILAVVVLIAAAAGGYLALTWSGFHPSKIVVSGNDAAVSSAQIVAAARIDRSKNLWLQDARAISSRVEAIAAIETATVHRSFPSTVTIAVTERRPWAVVGTAGAASPRAVVDRELRVLSLAGDGDAPALTAIETNEPLSLKTGAFLRNDQVVAMRDDLDALRAAHVDASALRYDRYESLIATLRDGTLVLLGDDGSDLQKKVALIGPIRAQLAKGRPIAAIDLRAPGTPVVRYK